ncbi:MAG: OmpA family protein [Bacteroidia bacterium]|nr:OmpA family protein [Bacteroidia bacterium]NNF30018.1 OmpA family protein [Flavobacteriaceae bacterium]MBT8274739.1 OmpA family protein [Bacteroidia bacterium]NNJ81491.1 OmpA family protein [Flavobacteriaceae bacterium]NNK53723.1 OmpA family protein [Flavobacteriaceae bacterium]
MKNFLIAFLVFLVWSFFGLWLYSWLQPDNEELPETTEVAIKNSEEGTNETKVDTPSEIKGTPLVIGNDSTEIVEAYKEEFISAPTTGLRAISETDDIIFFYPEGFIIRKNSQLVDVPSNLVDFKYKLNTYILEHPDTELHITSQYSPGENIESPNLGIKRGQVIKQLLVETGISSEKIVIKPFITQIAFSTEDTFRHSFSFTFKPLNNERIEALKKQIPETRVVYPEFSYQGILVNEDLLKLRQEVSDIIKENPNLHLEVVGHTDNVGNAIDNYTKGLEYARQLRWFLVNKSGIDRNKITAVSKGESEAIAGNGTEKGRNLNRRLEVKFYLDTDE